MVSRFLRSVLRFLCSLIDPIAWRCDVFASTVGAAARSRQFCSVTKDEIAILTTGRVQDKLFCLVPRNGLHDMGQMIFDLTLRDAQHLGQLKRGEPSAGQQIDEALAGRSLVRQHGGPS